MRLRILKRSLQVILLLLKILHTLILCRNLRLQLPFHNPQIIFDKPTISRPCLFRGTTSFLRQRIRLCLVGRK